MQAKFLLTKLNQSARSKGETTSSTTTYHAASFTPLGNSSFVSCKLIEQIAAKHLERSFRDFFHDFQHFRSIPFTALALSVQRSGLKHYRLVFRLYELIHTVVGVDQHTIVGGGQPI